MNLPAETMEDKLAGELFMRAAEQIAAIGVLVLLTSLSCSGIVVASEMAEPAGQQPTGQAGQQSQKQYEDRAEFDLATKIDQTSDPQARLVLLKQWRDRYPQSDFADERLRDFINTLAQLAPKDPAARIELLHKCVEALKSDPKDFRANYCVALWGPDVGGANPPRELVNNVESAAGTVLDVADDTFGASKKPAIMNDAMWSSSRNKAIAAAHNALAWGAASKKDTATAEDEYKASLQADPDQGTISVAYARLLIDDKNYAAGLFEYARAAQYAGPGPAVREDARAKLLDYVNKSYKALHGSADGAQQFLAQAMASALPPAELTIISPAELVEIKPQRQTPLPASPAELDALKKVRSDQQARNWDAQIADINSVLQNFGNSEYKNMLLDMGIQAAQNKGDYGQAVEFGEKAIAADPNNAEAHVRLAQAIALHLSESNGESDADKDQDIQKAQTYSKHALDLLNHDAASPWGVSSDQWPIYKKQLVGEAHDALGMAAAAARKYPEAIDEYRVGLRAYSNPIILTHLAQAYIDAKQFDEAIATDDEILAMAAVPDSEKQLAQKQKDAAAGLKENK
jgi:tetratricopeptide (TPR) repeat protein